MKLRGKGLPAIPIDRITAVAAQHRLGAHHELIASQCDPGGIAKCFAFHPGDCCHSARIQIDQRLGEIDRGIRRAAIAVDANQGKICLAVLIGFAQNRFSFGQHFAIQRLIQANVDGLPISKRAGAFAELDLQCLFQASAIRRDIIDHAELLPPITAAEEQRLRGEWFFFGNILGLAEFL